MAESEEIILNLKVNGSEDIDKIGSSIEKLAKGSVDAVAGISLAFGASKKSSEELEKSFVKIIGVAKGLKGGIEAITESTKLLGGPLTAIIAAAGILYAAYTTLTSKTDEVTEAVEKQTLAFQKLQNQLDFNSKYLTETQRLETELLKTKTSNTEDLIKLQQKQNVENQNQLLEEEAANNKRIAEIQNMSEEEAAALEDGGKSLNDELKRRLDAQNQNLIDQKKVADNFLILDAQLTAAQKKNADDAATEEADALKKRQDAWKEYTNNRITAARQIRDLEISVIEDEGEKEQATINAKYDRIIEDAKNNEKLLQSERTQIIEDAQAARLFDLVALQKKEDDAIEAQRKKDLQDQKDALDKYNDLIRGDIINDFSKRRADASAEYTKQLEDLQTLLDNKKITQEQYNEGLLAAQNKLNADYNTIQSDQTLFEQEQLDAKLAMQDKLVESVSSSLGSISQLFKQNSAASKVAALAQIAVDTGLGFIQGLRIAQQGAAATGPAAPLAFPVFYATQVAAVLSAAAKAKGILQGGSDSSVGSVSSTPSVPSSSSLSSSSSSVPADTTLFGTAGAFNNIGPGSGSNGQGSGGNSGPIRAYVVGSNVTNQQQEEAAYAQAFTLSVH